MLPLPGLKTMLMLSLASAFQVSFKSSNGQLGVTDMSRRRRRCRRDHARDSMAYLCQHLSRNFCSIKTKKYYAQDTTEYCNLNWSVASQFHADANPSHCKRTCDIFKSSHASPFVIHCIAQLKDFWYHVNSGRG